MSTPTPPHPNPPHPAHPNPTQPNPPHPHNPTEPVLHGKTHLCAMPIFTKVPSGWLPGSWFWKCSQDAQLMLVLEQKTLSQDHRGQSNTDGRSLLAVRSMRVDNANIREVQTLGLQFYPCLNAMILQPASQHPVPPFRLVHHFAVASLTPARLPSK